MAYFVTLSDSEGSMRFFAEFTLSEILRSLCSLRMTRSEGLRMTGSEGLRMTGSEGLRMTDGYVEKCAAWD